MSRAGSAGAIPSPRRLRRDQRARRSRPPRDRCRRTGTTAAVRLRPTARMPRSPTDTNVRFPWTEDLYGLIGSTRMSSRAVTSSFTSARHDLERLTDFGRDGVADLRRVGDVVEMAAAGVGELLQEPLIEVIADAERRCRDPSRPQFGGMGREHGRVGLADVGQTVRQEQTPIDAILELVPGKLLATAKPPFATNSCCPRASIERRRSTAARRDSAEAWVDSMTVSTTSS